MKSKQRTNLPIREAQLHLSFVAQVKLVVGEDGELSIGDVESPTAPTAPPRTKEDIARLSSLIYVCLFVFVLFVCLFDQGGHCQVVQSHLCFFVCFCLFV